MPETRAVLGEPVYETDYDAAATTPSYEVVRAVADAADVDEVDLPPLFEVVDPDALDRLVAHDTAPGTGTTVRFAFAGWQVVLTGGGDLRLYGPLS